jgi:hypothetical protein
MNDLLQLLKQMIETVSESADDMQATAHDKANAGNQLDRDMAPMYAASALTLRVLVGDMIRVRGALLVNHLEDVQGLFEQQVELPVLRDVSNVVRLIRKTPIPGEHELVDDETIGTFVDRHTKGDDDD